MAQWNKISERWKIEDRRSSNVMRVWSIGLVWILMFAAVWYLSGKDPASILLDTLEYSQEFSQTENITQDDEYSWVDAYEAFVSTVLGSNNTFWESTLAQAGSQYQEPTVVLFRSGTYSACGGAQAQYGPHYCPADETIYLDETFFDELSWELWAQGGDVAEAYVIAHEVWHHLQNILEITDMYSRSSNEESIAIELQADCLAGVWLGYIDDQNVLEQNEILEALDAAWAVWDDRIQKKATGEVHPETWTHGSSEQRKEWFMTGYNSKNLNSCNTSEI